RGGGRARRTVAAGARPRAGGRRRSHRHGGDRRALARDPRARADADTGAGALGRARGRPRRRLPLRALRSVARRGRPRAGGRSVSRRRRRKAGRLATLLLVLCVSALAIAAGIGSSGAKGPKQGSAPSTGVSFDGGYESGDPTQWGSLQYQFARPVS